MKNNQITWLSISKKALIHNYKEFEKIVSPKTQIMAVVKSNAYGHGLVECAKIFNKAGVKWLGTVNLDEALTLRQHNLRCRILVLSYFDPNKLIEAVKKNITLTIYSYQAAQQLDKIGNKLKRKIKIHFKVDTGTSRLGILTEESFILISKILKLPYIKIEGIFSHLADSENPNQKFTNKQISKFNRLIQQLEKQGINIPIKHIGCSASTLLNRKSHFDLVRLGISLYGQWSIKNNGSKIKNIHTTLSLQSALSWYTKIIQIKSLPPNTEIGYGCTYRSIKKLKIALIPVGYWEGFDRKLSNSGEVLIKGIKCKIRGRICMNLSIVDISQINNAKAGDRVTLIGSDKNNVITVDEIANKLNTINYEVITRINPLIIRKYNN